MSHAADIVDWDILQLARRLGLDQLRARDVHEHTAATPLPPDIKADIDGLGQLEVVGRGGVDNDVGGGREELDGDEVVVEALRC